MFAAGGGERDAYLDGGLIPGNEFQANRLPTVIVIGCIQPIRSVGWIVVRRLFDRLPWFVSG